MSELIISVSGLRGVIGEQLTPELAGRFAAAFVAGQPEGPIVLARDGRTTGRMLADAVRAALCACGRSVVDASVAATPTAGVLVRQYAAAGGIQISASHNPPEYNGLKLFSATGRVINAQAGQLVLQRFQHEQARWVGYQEIGQVDACEDTLSRHAELILATVDRERIAKRQFNVVLDSNHGAGSLLGRQLLERLGCRVQVLGEEPHGRFAHRPEPTALNLAEVCRLVAEQQADVGFCQDPDADRLALIDGNGSYVGEEYTLALCLDHVLRQQPGPVVTNCATSRMARDLAAKFEVPFHLAPVGEANVVDVMLAQEARFGGEGNGGPIDPRVGYIRDSFVGMALILDAMAFREMPVDRLAAELPRYAIHKTTVPLPKDQLETALAALEHYFADAQTNRMDGLRLDWLDRWLLIRASNTEPIVRVIAEAANQQQALELCRLAAEHIAEVTE